MWNSLIFFINFLDALRPTLREGECPDEDLGNLCDGHCYIDFLACRDACDSSGCERTCLAEYTGCYTQCPCYDLCPSGCSDCPHSVCTCRSPEINNVDYQQCIKEAQDRFIQCHSNCTADTSCYDECYASLSVETEKCPCNQGCPLGCPCDNGYDCQNFLMAVCSNSAVGFSYMISASGHIKENRYFSTPLTSPEFIYNVGSTILHNEIYLFGGNQDQKKILKLNGCSVEDTGKKLSYNFYSYQGSLITVPEILQETILCNAYNNPTKCEAFDGDSIHTMPDLQNLHTYSCMSIYKGQAVIIAGEQSHSVELLELSGWKEATTHPAGSFLKYHTCASIEEGILTVGGNNGNDIKDVYLFKNNEWSIAGQMTNFQRAASMIFFETFFIVFGGINNFNSVERAEWKNDKVISASVINEHGFDCFRPIVFETTPSHCSEFCSEAFCYLK